MTIEIETFPNPNIRTYHVRDETPAIEGASLIPGIVEAKSSRRYQFRVEKARAYAWEEIEPLIMEGLKGGAR